VTDKLKQLRVDLPSFKDEKKLQALEDITQKDKHLKEKRAKQL
jgi:hypothetical protein